MLHYLLDWLAAEFSAYLRKMALYRRVKVQTCNVVLTSD
jgi:hypothetical protein